MKMGLVRYRNSNANINDEGTFWISISDLMAGLLIIFILTLTYFMLNLSQATAQLTESNSKRAEILLTIEGLLKEKGINVKVIPEYGVLRLPDGILFNPGKAEINETGRNVIGVLAPILYDVLTRPEYIGSVETVFIEGHTDNRPLASGRFASNWELSTQRAINTWRIMEDTVPSLENLKNGRGEQIISCSGYAYSRPVASNDTPEGRKENRRIDLRFSMTPPSHPDRSDDRKAPLIKDIKRELNS